MKKILFSVLGLSPQILTETLYALKNENNLPDEIYVLTTGRGASLCKKALFQEDGGWFYRFCQDWKVSGIKFDQSHIYTTNDNNGIPIDDIRTRQDNHDVANQIVDLVRELSVEDNSELHVSIAGGRKTMGVYASYALSMFGREQDQLSHVLVNEEFEGHQSFFYPTPDSQLIRTRDGKELLDCHEALVELAYLPFLAMRSVIPENFTHSQLSYDDMVKRLQKRIFDKKVLISVSDQTLSIGGEIISLTRVNFAFYYWVSKCIKEGQDPLITPYQDEPNIAYAQSFLRALDEVLKELDDDDKTREPLQQEGMSFEFIRDRRNSIKNALVKALGAQNAEDFIIGYDRNSRHISPRLKSHQIEFI